MTTPHATREGTDSRSGPGVETDLEEPSLIAIAIVFLEQWRKIALCGIAGFVVGAASGLLSTRQYTASATFMPQTSTDANAAGGLAFAASQFGIRMPTGGGGWTAPIYVDLLASRGLLAPIAQESLLVREMGNRRMAMPTLLELNNVAASERLERTVRKLRRHISASEVKRLGAVKLIVTTPWPSVSLTLAERLLAGVNNFNLITRKSQASAERVFIETQVRDAKRLLRESEDQLLSFMQRNRMLGTDQEFERDRLQRDMMMRQQAYTSLLQSYAEARLREIRDTPVITVLEAPVLPVLGDARQTAIKAVIGGLTGGILGMILVLVLSARGSTNKQLRRLFETANEMLPRSLRQR